jgi:hypothetical protein
MHFYFVAKHASAFLSIFKEHKAKEVFAKQGRDLEFYVDLEEGSDELPMIRKKIEKFCNDNELTFDVFVSGVPLRDTKGALPFKEFLEQKMIRASFHWRVNAVKGALGSGIVDVKAKDDYSAKFVALDLAMIRLAKQQSIFMQPFVADQTSGLHRTLQMVEIIYLFLNHPSASDTAYLTRSVEFFIRDLPKSANNEIQVYHSTPQYVNAMIETYKVLERFQEEGVKIPLDIMNAWSSLFDD